MINWNESMKQTYEFYIVDPNTWADMDIITTIESCTINRNESDETLGSAKFKSTDILNECYIRVYLIATQKNEKEKIVLGTFLAQTPSTSFDGKTYDINIDEYTPLIELKTDMPPIGYSILKGQQIMETAYDLCQEHIRAPVVKPTYQQTINNNYIADKKDTWLSFLSSFIANAKFKFNLDEMGRVLFAPEQDIASLSPKYKYTDDNSSILYPSIEDDNDTFDIPNVVEIVSSTESGYLISRIENNDVNSPVSIANRGRKVIYREENPSLYGEANQAYLDEYAKQVLRDKSCLEHTISYTHGYCPVRVGDCVLLNYKRAGIVNVKAKVISQSIKCETGCVVEEKAIYTESLWRG